MRSRQLLREDFSPAKQLSSARPLLTPLTCYSRPHFARDVDRDFEALEPHIQRLLGKLERLSEIQSSGQNGQPFVVELQDPFLRLAVDFSTETLFGKSTDSLLEND